MTPANMIRAESISLFFNIFQDAKTGYGIQW